jgi:hypothetical protein
MENRIYYVASEDLITAIKPLIDQKKAHIAKIHGKYTSNWGDYGMAISKEMKFPTSCVCSIDVYLDWIRDLMWLDADSYIIIIYEWHEFLKHDAKLKKLIIDLFVEEILPWWAHEVEKYLVCGRIKPFNVFLVD